MTRHLGLVTKLLGGKMFHLMQLALGTAQLIFFITSGSHAAFLNKLNNVVSTRKWQIVFCQETDKRNPSLHYLKWTLLSEKIIYLLPCNMRSVLLLFSLTSCATAHQCILCSYTSAPPELRKATQAPSFNSTASGREFNPDAQECFPPLITCAYNPQHPLL